MKGVIALVLYFLSRHSFAFPSPKSLRLRNPSNHKFQSFEPPTAHLTSLQKRVSPHFMTEVDESVAKNLEPNNGSWLNDVINLVGSSTSVVVSVTFFAVLAYRRDALMVAFFIGSISNGILSKVLKRALNQDRPDDISSDIKFKPNDKGMPSSHAMSLGFICTFAALRVPHSKVFLLLYVVSSLYYRVKKNLHTWNQIAVGLIVGVINSVGWNSLCSETSAFSVVKFLEKSILPSNGLLPVPLLIIPAALGLVVVGSLECRLQQFFKGSKEA
mmetsp:Transcript_27761/g.42727  ORF Transcript_27761/g.42727 Transcript_27761/m.42727 type:complete len:272 (-) Transcript_27761:1039-1854(-)